MSKFKIIILSVLGFAVIAGLTMWHYLVSFHSITLNVKGEVTSIVYKVIDNKDQSSLKTIKSTVAMSLQNGQYCVKPTDTKYDTSAICFTVQNKDMSITIDPDYSANYLEQLLITQIDQINSVITTKYGPIIDSYTLIGGVLYGKGEWYGTTLTEKVAPSDRGDIYRVLLEKKGNSWVIIAYPQIVLSKFDYPQVPFTVLSDVNKLLGVY